MVAALVVLLGLGLLAAYLVSGVWNLISTLRGSRPDRRRSAALGGAKLTAATLLGIVPWIAVPIAESSTGWVDADRDGMLDGFVNGSYDWVDINGAAWAAASTVLIVLIAAFVTLTLALIRKPSDETAERRRSSA